jgi:hypothetical protein
VLVQEGVYPVLDLRTDLNQVQAVAEELSPAS